jgi:hypothetical protein
LEGTRKIGRPCKRGRNEVEENLNIMGIKNGQAMVRASWERRNIALESKVHNGRYCLRWWWRRRNDSSNDDALLTLHKESIWLPKYKASHPTRQ